MRTRGFTLVELVVVVIVLAILCVIGLPRFDQMLQNSRMASTVSSWNGFASGVILYYGDNKSFPNDTVNNAFPVGFAGYIRDQDWKRPVPIGGVWDWNAPPNGGWAGKPHNISITLSPQPTAAWRVFDRTYDDDELGTGNYLVFAGRTTNYCRPIE